MLTCDEGPVRASRPRARALRQALSIVMVLLASARASADSSCPAPCPLLPPANPGIKLATGWTHGCSIRANDNSLWCWGSNQHGELGNSDHGFTESNGTSPDRWSPFRVPGTWLDVAVGNGVTCGLTLNRRGYCWGSNAYGQLGLNDTASRDSPHSFDAATSEWIDIDASSHVCAVRADGRLYCWGNNVLGELGLGNTVRALAPRAVSDGWSSISVGGSHTCGLKGTDLYCWGSNLGGQIGVGTTTLYYTRPTRVPPPNETSWKSVDLGGTHTCATTLDERLYCWGSTAVLGPSEPSPRLVGAIESDGAVITSGWAQVSAGSAHTCAIHKNGQLWCWGANSFSQLGTGTTSPTIATPTLVGTATELTTAISAGKSFTCSIRDGAVHCWGLNSLGQLGLGDTVNRTTPAHQKEAIEPGLKVAATACSDSAIEAFVNEVRRARAICTRRADCTREYGSSSVDCVLPVAEGSVLPDAGSLNGCTFYAGVACDMQKTHCRSFPGAVESTCQTQRDGCYGSSTYNCLASAEGDYRGNSYDLSRVASLFQELHCVGQVAVTVETARATLARNLELRCMSEQFPDGRYILHTINRRLMEIQP